MFEQPPRGKKAAYNDNWAARQVVRASAVTNAYAQQREAEWAALVDAADDQLQFVGEWMRDTVQRVKGQMEPGDSVTDSARGCPSWPAGSRGFEPACLLPKR